MVAFTERGAMLRAPITLIPRQPIALVTALRRAGSIKAPGFVGGAWVRETDNPVAVGGRRSQGDPIGQVSGCLEVVIGPRNSGKLEQDGAIRLHRDECNGGGRRLHRNGCRGGTA